eukprot:jgi/Galph1/5607/GphlegSOOS_G4296.1
MLPGVEGWFKNQDPSNGKKLDLESGERESRSSSYTEGYYTPPGELEIVTPYVEEADEVVSRLSATPIDQSYGVSGYERPLISSERFRKESATNHQLASFEKEPCSRNLETLTKEEKLKQSGNSLFLQGNYSAAVEYYNAVLNENPNKLSVFANRAMCYLRLRQFDEAIQDGERCIGMNPIWSKGYYIKGMALLYKGNSEMAAACFNCGLEYCPGDLKLIEGKREAMRQQVGNNNGESVENMRGSSFPLSLSSTSNNDESQNLVLSVSREGGNISCFANESENANKSPPGNDEIGGREYNTKENQIYVYAEHDEPSIDTEVSRILHAPNFYSVLRVPMNCTHEEIERNYEMLSQLLNSNRKDQQNVEEAYRLVDTAHEVLSSVIKKRLYNRFLQDKKRKKHRRNSSKSSVIDNHVEVAESGRNIRWDINETEVVLPKFLDHILRVRKIGWFLLMVLFVLFLPLIAVLFLAGFILWILLSPIVKIIKRWYPYSLDRLRSTVHPREEAERHSRFSFFRNRRTNSGSFACLPIGS